MQLRPIDTSYGIYYEIARNTQPQKVQPLNPVYRSGLDSSSDQSSRSQFYNREGKSFSSFLRDPKDVQRKALEIAV